MVTRRTGRVSGIRGRVALAAAGVAFGVGTVVTGIAQGALTTDSGSHLRLGDVGWNNTNPHVVAGDVGWNNPQPGTTPPAPATTTPAPGPTNDVGWN
ncbi:hypothetical protein [Streptomyces sp. NPDC001568]|uniref:hypothetical protein n=1 Tax=Streptomyces sp. NPDC001568 TaxID=3364588 RepID=UPI0036AB01C3